MRREKLEKGRTIGRIAKENVTGGMQEYTPASLMINTALAMRQRWETASPRYRNFVRKYSSIKSLADLKSLLDSMSEKEFCQKVLGMTIKRPDFWRYKMLTELVDAFLSYKRRKGLKNDWDAILKWGRGVNLDDLDRDPVGRINRVGPATVQNLRLFSGIDTSKPDVHVLKVLHRLVDEAPTRFVELISKDTGYRAAELDQIFWYWDSKRNK
jgi:hypothetical protein